MTTSKIEEARATAINYVATDYDYEPTDCAGIDYDRLTYCVHENSPYEYHRFVQDRN